MLAMRNYQKSIFLLFSSIFVLSGCIDNKGIRENLKNNIYENFHGDHSLEKKNLNIIFWGHDLGEILRCECSLNPYGGLDRKLNFINKNKNQSSLILSYGNNLSLLEGDTNEEQIEERLNIYSAFLKEAKIDAYNIATHDLSIGLARLQKLSTQSQAPFLSSNIVDEQSNEFLFKNKITKNIPKLGEVSILGLSGAPKGNGYVLKDPIIALEEQLKNIPKTSLVLVLVDLGLEKIEELAQKINRPLVFIGSSIDSELSLFTAYHQSIHGIGSYLGKKVMQVELNYINSEHWFDAANFEINKKNWEILSAKIQALKSDEKIPNELEFEYQDLLSLAPQKNEKHNAFKYQSIFLDLDYAQKNNLTPLLEKYQKKYRPEEVSSSEKK